MARLDGVEQVLVTYPDNVAGGYTVVPGDGTSHFGLVLNAADPPVCTQGYGGTDKRTPAGHLRRARPTPTPAAPLPRGQRLVGPRRPERAGALGTVRARPFPGGTNPDDDGQTRFAVVPDRVRPDQRAGHGRGRHPAGARVRRRPARGIRRGLMDVAAARTAEPMRPTPVRRSCCWSPSAWPPSCWPRCPGPGPPTRPTTTPAAPRSWPPPASRPSTSPPSTTGTSTATWAGCCTARPATSASSSGPAPTT